MIKQVKSKFIVNSSTLLFGTIIGQLITFIFLPVVTNLYSPEELGFYTTFISFSSIISIFYTLQYNQTIPISKSDKEQSELTIMSLGITTLIFSFLLFFSVSFGDKILINLGFSEFKKWKYYILLLSLLLSLSQTLNYWTLKQKKVKLISSTKISEGILFNFGTISPKLISSISKDISLLIYSKIISIIFTVFIFSVKIKGFSFKNSFFTYKNHLKNNISFPKYGFPHSLFTVSVKEIPVLVISSFFDYKLVGLYFISLKFSQIPFSMISSSLYDVFLVEFSESKNKMKTFRLIFFSFLKISFPLLIVFYISIENILNMILDDTYNESLKYIYVLVPLYYFKLISSVFCQTVLIFFKKQKYNFKMGVLIFILTILSYLIGYSLGSFIKGLIISVVSNIFIIFLKFYKSFKLIESDTKRLI